MLEIVVIILNVVVDILDVFVHVNLRISILKGIFTCCLRL